ncbi:MAG: YciI family protein [Candidatus Nanopelagicales bacterium]
MTEYLLAVHGSDDQANYANEEDMQAAFAAVAAFNEELQASGAWVFAGGLMPKDTAFVARPSADGVVRTDGPFLESKEHLGGFWVINVADEQTAFEWAAKGAVACAQPVEVRPFQGV